MREYIPHGLMVSQQDYNSDHCPVVSTNNPVLFSNATAWRFNSREVYYLSTETGRSLQFHTPVVVETQDGHVYVDMLQQETAASLQKRLWSLVEPCLTEPSKTYCAMRDVMPNMPVEVFSYFQRMLKAYAVNSIDKSILYASVCELARNALAYDELTAFLSLERMEAQFGYERIDKYYVEHGRSEHATRGAHALNMGYSSEKLPKQCKVAAGV